MLETIVIVLMILWLIGLFTGTAGNLIHLVLLTALVVLVARFISGRRTV